MLERRRRLVGDDDLLTWTIVHRRMVSPGRPLNLTRHRYLAGIYACRTPRMVLFKASQMGASEYAISYALHAADQRSATVLYIFPTDRHVSDFSSARLGPAIEASEYLASIVVEGGAADGKRGADRVTLKRVRDRFLYFRGALVGIDGSAPQLKSIDADVIVLDEVDEMDQRAPSIAQKRLGHSLIGEERWISTPTYPGHGIHAAWLESDQREWFVRCPHCGTRQALTIEHVVTEWDELGRPVAWHGQTGGWAWAACGKCGKELDRLAAGEWVAAAPGREAAGFHITKLFSPTASLTDLVRNLDTTDETKRREAFNQDLGLPYRPRGAGLDEATLDGLRREYAHKPAGPGALMGVDVGQVLHVVIRAPQNPETGERRQLWAGTVMGFDDLAPLVKRYNVATCVCDAMPETREARRFQASQRAGRVYLAYYAEQRVGLKSESPAEWKDDDGVVLLDRTRTLDETFARFQDGANTLPANARAIRDYYAQLQSPVRTTESGRDGRVTARYVETGPDHFAHAEGYCTAASLRPRRLTALGQGSARGW